MERISSTKNPMIREMRALKDKKARLESGCFLVEGEKLIGEAISCGLEMRALLAEDGLEVPGFAIPRQAFAVPRGILEAVCDTKSPQGMCATFALPEFLSIDRAPDRIIALDGVQDPGNLGTIWRTADAAGFEAILLGEGCADPFSPKVQRAAMGSSFRIGCMNAPNLAGELTRLSTRGYAIVASSLEGANFYQRPDVGEKFVLVIGNEARGISYDVIAASDVRLKLPMRGGAESLNAAVAAGIMMYELMRER